MKIQRYPNIIIHDFRLKFRMNYKKPITPQIIKLIEKSRDYCMTEGMVKYIEEIHGFDRDILEIFYQHLQEGTSLHTYEHFLRWCKRETLISELDMRYEQLEKWYEEYEKFNPKALKNLIHHTLAVILLEHLSNI